MIKPQRCEAVMTDVDFGGISEEKYNIWKEDLMPKKKKKLKKKKKAKAKKKKKR